MIIRPLEARDHAVCENVAREAFWNVYRPGCVEHLIVRRLQNDACAESRLFFVAEKGDAVVGLVMAAKGLLTWPCGSVTEHLCAGPLAVLPKYQRQGVGGALMERFLSEAGRLGWESVVLTGSPAYYARFGFVPAARHGIFLRGHSPAEELPYFMAKELTGEQKPWYGGFYEDPAAYVVLPEEADAFDAAFPPKEKRKLPGQLF